MSKIRKRRNQPERELALEILAWASSQPGVALWINTVTPGVWGVAGLGPGSPDLIGWKVEKIGKSIIPRFVCIELKTGKRLPTAAQRAWLERAAVAGALAGVAYSLEDVKKILKM